MIRKLLYAIADWVNENRRLRARVQQLLEANNQYVIQHRNTQAQILGLVAAYFEGDNENIPIGRSPVTKDYLRHRLLEAIGK